MSLLTSVLSGGGGTLANNRYGMWVMSSNYSAPPGKLVGVDDNRFDFDTVKSGSFPDFNTTTHKLTVTKRGMYALGWAGSLTGDDTIGGNNRTPIMRMTTSSLSGVANFIGSQGAKAAGITFLKNYSVSGDTFLDVGDVVEFGFEHDGAGSLVFADETTLRIVLLHTL